jgi:chromosome segregation ATPase
LNSLVDRQRACVSLHSEGSPARFQTQSCGEADATARYESLRASLAENQEIIKKFADYELITQQLREENQSLRIRVEGEGADLRSLQAKYSDLQKEIFRRETRWSSTHQKCKNLQKCVFELSRDLKALQFEFQEYLVHFSGEKLQELLTLNLKAFFDTEGQALSRRSNSISETQSEVAVMAMREKDLEIDRLLMKIEQLEDEGEQSKLRMATQISAIERGYAHQAKILFEEVEGLKAKFTSSVGKHKEEVRLLESELEKTVGQFVLRQARSSMRDTSNSVKARGNESSQSCETLDSVKTKYEEKIAELEKQVSLMKDQDKALRSSYEIEVKKLEEAMNELTEMIRRESEDHMTARDGFDSKIHELEQRVKELNREIEIKNAKLGALGKERRQWRLYLKEIRQEIENNMKFPLAPLPAELDNIDSFGSPSDGFHTPLSVASNKENLGGASKKLIVITSPPTVQQPMQRNPSSKLDSSMKKGNSAHKKSASEVLIDGTFGKPKKK